MAVFDSIMCLHEGKKPACMETGQERKQGASEMSPRHTRNTFFLSFPSPKFLKGSAVVSFLVNVIIWKKRQNKSFSSVSANSPFLPLFLQQPLPMSAPLAGHSFAFPSLPLPGLVAHSERSWPEITTAPRPAQEKQQHQKSGCIPQNVSACDAASSLKMCQPVMPHPHPCTDPKSIRSQSTFWVPCILPGLQKRWPLPLP